MSIPPCFLVYGYKIIEKSQNPSDNVDPASRPIYLCPSRFDDYMIKEFPNAICTTFKVRSTPFLLKVIRHVFGFGIEFLENKDIGIFGHYIVIDLIKRHIYHTYFSPISTSWFRRFGTGCIVRNGEWRIFVNYSVFSALFSLKLRILLEDGILGTTVQTDAVPPIFISNYQRSKPNSTTTDLCIELSLFTSH